MFACLYLSRTCILFASLSLHVCVFVSLPYFYPPRLSLYTCVRVCTSPVLLFSSSISLSPTHSLTDIVICLLNQQSYPVKSQNLSLYEIEKKIYWHRFYFSTSAWCRKSLIFNKWYTTLRVDNIDADVMEARLPVCKGALQGIRNRTFTVGWLSIYSSILRVEKSALFSNEWFEQNTTNVNV